MGVLRDEIRLLTFRLTRDEFDRLDRRHLIFGLTATWLVGMGRWWDDPGASLLQHLGLGSVVYVFVLSATIWLVVKPLNPAKWTYCHVLTFISLTSPPAILYAIPVERFADIPTARSINVWFLATVAICRVALLFFFLRRHARLKCYALVSASLLPLTAIVVTLSVLNLERVAFDVMGGLRDTGNPNDAAYSIVFGLSLLSVVLFIPIVIVYAVTVAMGGRLDEDDSRDGVEE